MSISKSIYESINEFEFVNKDELIRSSPMLYTEYKKSKADALNITLPTILPLVKSFVVLVHPLIYKRYERVETYKSIFLIIGFTYELTEKELDLLKHSLTNPKNLFSHEIKDFFFQISYEERSLKPFDILLDPKFFIKTSCMCGSNVPLYEFRYVEAVIYKYICECTINLPSIAAKFPQVQFLVNWRIFDINTPDIDVGNTIMIQTYSLEELKNFVKNAKIQKNIRAYRGNMYDTIFLFNLTFYTEILYRKTPSYNDHLPVYDKFWFNFSEWIRIDKAPSFEGKKKGNSRQTDAIAVKLYLNEKIIEEVHDWSLATLLRNPNFDAKHFSRNIIPYILNTAVVPIIESCPRLEYMEIVFPYKYYTGKLDNRIDKFFDIIQNFCDASYRSDLTTRKFQIMRFFKRSVLPSLKHLSIFSLDRETAQMADDSRFNIKNVLDETGNEVFRHKIENNLFPSSKRRKTDIENN